MGLWCSSFDVVALFLTGHEDTVQSIICLFRTSTDIVALFLTGHERTEQSIICLFCTSADVVALFLAGYEETEQSVMNLFYIALGMSSAESEALEGYGFVVLMAFVIIIEVSGCALRARVLMRCVCTTSMHVCSACVHVRSLSVFFIRACVMCVRACACNVVVLHI